MILRPLHPNGVEPDKKQVVSAHLLDKPIGSVNRKVPPKVQKRAKRDPAAVNSPSTAVNEAVNTKAVNRGRYQNTDHRREYMKNYMAVYRSKA